MGFGKIRMGEERSEPREMREERNEWAWKKNKSGTKKWA